MKIGDTKVGRIGVVINLVYEKQDHEQKLRECIKTIYQQRLLKQSHENQVTRLIKKIDEAIIGKGVNLEDNDLLI